jgi:hypothetical protein
MPTQPRKQKQIGELQKHRSHHRRGGNKRYSLNSGNQQEMAHSRVGECS